MKRRPISLRVVLLLIGLSTMVYVVAVAIQVVFVLRPTASELRGLTGNLLTDHDRIDAALRELRDARRHVEALLPPATAMNAAVADSLREHVRALLDANASSRAAVERADMPLEMRLLLVQAIEHESAVGLRLLETLRHLELGNQSAAVVAWRDAEFHADTTARLLSSSQRVAISDLLSGEDALLSRLQVIDGWSQLWLAVGVLLFVATMWLMNTRVLRPVRAMESAVREVAAGNLATEVETGVDDELGRLARHLNEMTSVLRERAAEESRRRENLTERFGRILDESANQIMVFDADDLRLLQANRGARTAMGYDRAELERLRLPDIFREIGEARLRGLLEDLRTGTQRRALLATALVARDGTSLPAEVTLQRASDGESAFLIAVAEDAGIRQRVRALDERLRAFTFAEQAALTSGDLETALRPLTAMAADALAASGCGVWRAGTMPLTCVVAYDARAKRHSTTAPWPLGRAGLGTALEVPVHAGGRVAAHVVIERDDGPNWTPEERTFVGAVADVVVRALDASERRGLELALERAQRLDAIGQLAGGVAHDFNNILTAILGNLEACRIDLAPGSPMHASLAEAEQAALRAADLTRQLLTFARHQVSETSVVDVNARTRDAEPMLKRLAGATVTVHTALEVGLAPVRLGAGQLEQLLVNFVVNARDAMPKGGIVTISTRTAPPSGTDATPSVELAVSDTGDGMDAATLERIFEPFFTTKRLGEGTGLGLAVCYGIVRNAGGTIAVSSTPGRGSTFRILLPSASGEPSALRAESPRNVRGDGELILLAEDEPAIRALMQRMLQSRGYRVLAAADGAEAIALAATHDDAIALLISDVVMPGTGGVAAARQIRAGRPGLPVLFMSGFTDTPSVQSGDLEDAEFMSKPFTPEELVRRVRRILDHKTTATGAGIAPVASRPTQ